MDFDWRNESWMKVMRQYPTSTWVPTLFNISSETEIEPGSGKSYDLGTDTEMVDRFAGKQAERDADFEGRHPATLGHVAWSEPEWAFC